MLDTLFWLATKQLLDTIMQGLANPSRNHLMNDIIFYTDSCDGSANEAQLLTDLLKNYNPAVHPSLSEKEPVTVLLDLSIQAIIDLVGQEECVSLSLYICP